MATVAKCRMLRVGQTKVVIKLYEDNDEAS